MTTGMMTDRAVLRVGGAEARDWLQSLLSNDLRRLAPDAALYAALLSPQGKYLFDMVLTEAGDSVLIDVAADRAESLAARLRMYALRRKVTLEPASTLRVALFWGEAPTDPRALPDPRDPRMGWRLVAEDAQAEGGGRAAYDALRVACAVPETGVELIPEESFILECGFERLNGVDFRKGCYVGQEVTARMRHKTILRKGLVRVGLDGDAACGDEIRSGDGRLAGVLHTISGAEALAHLRFDRAEGMTAGAARVTLLSAGSAGDPPAPPASA